MSKKTITTKTHALFAIKHKGAEVISAFAETRDEAERIATMVGIDAVVIRVRVEELND